jgi:hypothetical protein
MDQADRTSLSVAHQASVALRVFSQRSSIAGLCGSPESKEHNWQISHHAFARSIGSSKLISPANSLISLRLGRALTGSIPRNSRKHVKAWSAASLFRSGSITSKISHEPLVAMGAAAWPLHRPFSDERQMRPRCSPVAVRSNTVCGKFRTLTIANPRGKFMRLIHASAFRSVSQKGYCRIVVALNLARARPRGIKGSIAQIRFPPHDKASSKQNMTLPRLSNEEIMPIAWI